MTEFNEKNFKFLIMLIKNFFNYVNKKNFINIFLNFYSSYINMSIRPVREKILLQLCILNFKSFGRLVFALLYADRRTGRIRLLL